MVMACQLKPLTHSAQTEQHENLSQSPFPVLSSLKSWLILKLSITVSAFKIFDFFTKPLLNFTIAVLWLDMVGLVRADSSQPRGSKPCHKSELKQLRPAKKSCVIPIFCHDKCRLAVCQECSQTGATGGDQRNIEDSKLNQKHNGTIVPSGSNPSCCFPHSPCCFGTNCFCFDVRLPQSPLSDDWYNY